MELPKAFRLMIGTWTGTLVKLDAEGREQDRLAVTIDCAFDRDESGYRLNQRNRTESATGEISEVVVAGPVDAEGRLHLDTASVEGLVVDRGGSVFAEWTSKQDPAVRCWEMTTFLTPDARIRTWHHSRAGEAEAVSVFYEQRC